MNHQDYEALEKVIEAAEAWVLLCERESVPVDVQKKAIQTTKDGILKHLGMLRRIVSGDLTIDVADG